MRYAFIDAEKVTEHNPDGHGVSLMCRILGVSRSGYYAWRAARPAAEARADQESELVTEIRKLQTQSRRAYCSPRVTAALRRKGRRINRERVERLMREHDLRGITRRRRRSLTRLDKKAVFSLTWSNVASPPSSPAPSWSRTSPICPPLPAGGTSPPSSTWPPGR
ncbi:hypothetical protein SHKM778_60880 [Streptomyces sp. KM77-8]|uniref:HTH-like domain-containing protein n=1 Tax=Streptomyces haneummycinicus TaxID=3074435 RepID=A0AAT9HR91_9ACTN